MDDETRERLVKIEESQGFTAHDLDQLSDQVRGLYAAVDRLARRIEVLERRADEAGEPSPETGEPDDAGV